MIQRFGPKLRYLRQRHGLTLRELAGALGYAGTGYLSDIEFGKKYPTADLILKASRFFGVSMDQLAKDEIDLVDNDDDAADGHEASRTSDLIYERTFETD